MHSAAPIRFDPGTPNNSTTQSLGSQSSLSSSMTPESISLTLKFNNRSSGEIFPNNNSNSQKSVTALASHEPSSMSIPADHLSTSALPIDGRPVGESKETMSARSAPYQASMEGPKLAGKLTTQYVMPDGSVITGKGLGRGRPGVKRGPRRSKAPDEDSVESTSSVPVSITPSLVSPAVAKRKRADSDAFNIRARSVSSSLLSRESSVEYNPTATQTRSGRQTYKPTPLMPPAMSPTVTASPATRKVSTPTTATSVPPLKSHPKIKRKIYRGKEAFALCEHCLRGFGPPGNVIVFCDACNKCWHQRCHHPQISKEIVADSKAEWFCATCDKILHGSKKPKKLSLVSESKAAPAPMLPSEQKFGPPYVGAIALTLDQRRKYVESLTREQLINLLLRAGELAPQMPIFETPIPIPQVGPYLQPQFTSNYVTPVSTVTGTEQNITTDVTDEGYDDTYDEHAALYPKIGEGIKLPPERDDLNMLLEGPESRTFSHWVKGLPVKTVVDTVPLHQSQPPLQIQAQVAR